MTDHQLPEHLAGLLTELYTAGYVSGHHDTVEGNYTDINYRDRATELRKESECESSAKINAIIKAAIAVDVQVGRFDYCGVCHMTGDSYHSSLCSIGNLKEALRDD